MMRFAALLCLLALPLQAQEGDPITGFSDKDPVMNAAIATAQKTLPLFLCASVDDEGYGPPGGFLKVRYPATDADFTHEIIWVGPFAAWNGEDFAGFLANQPHAMGSLNRGDQIDFTYDMIVDWSWHADDRKTFGDFTTRVILKKNNDANSLAQLAGLSNPAYNPSWSCE